MLTETKITWDALQSLIADAKRGAAISQGTCQALGDEIVRCEVLLGGGLYRQLLCLRLFDEAQGWEGWASLEAWMSVKLGLPYKTANERVRVARKLAHIPQIEAAFRDGQLSYTKVRAIHDVATPENEGTLLELALPASGEQLRRLAAPLRAAVKRSKSSQAEREQERRVSFCEHPSLDLVEVRAILLPEEAAAVRKMLEVALELEVKLRRPELEPSSVAEAEPAPRRSDSDLEVGSDSAAAESREAGADPAEREASGSSEDPAEADPPEAGASRTAGGALRGPSAPGADSAAADRSETEADAVPAESAAGSEEDPAAGGIPTKRHAARLGGGSAAEEPRDRFSLADALVFAAESFLADPPRSGVPAGRREIMIHAYPDSGSDSGQGAESGPGPNLGSGLLETGEGLSPETVQRLACDGATVRVKRGAGGEVLDMGRRTRRIGRSLGRALEVRDRCCRFPGCTRRAMLDFHHIVAWSQGGKTNLANLVRLCRTHHRRVHEGGWELRDSDGELEFLDPCGRSVTSVGQLPQLSAAEAHARLSSECRSQGLEAQPEQLAALDGGAPVDYGYATSVLTECCGFEVDPNRPDQPPPAIDWLQRHKVA